MASAQVLPNSVASSSSSSSRKQGHLEAGKRRLEEFRKKKAQAKKNASNDQSPFADVASASSEQALQGSQQAKILDSDGVSKRDNGVDQNITASDNLMSTSSVWHDAQAVPVIRSSVTVPLHGRHSTDNVENSDASLVQIPRRTEVSAELDSGGFPGPMSSTNDIKRIEEKNQHDFHKGNGITPQILTDQFASFTSVHGAPDVDERIRRANSYGSIGPKLNEESGIYDIFGRSSQVNTTSEVPEHSQVEYSRPTSNRTSSSYYDLIYSNSNKMEPASKGWQNGPTVDMEGRNSGVSGNNHSHINSIPWQASETTSTASNFSSGSSYNHVPLVTAASESSSHRSRPSFLDSLNVPRVSLATHPAFSDSYSAESSMKFKTPEVKFMEHQTNESSQLPFPEAKDLEHSGTLNDLDVQSMNDHSLSVSSHSISHDIDSLRQLIKDENSQRQFENLSKKNEDFAALEQHIEDLTQEKFSLQRALDASRTLAETLALENSSLTDSFNQQGGVVNQLKSDLSRLQEEIKVQLLGLDTMKMEYTNAQLECSAADERAKILASEVIGLEEKALRLRSNELKLERQLENSNAEFASCKKKISNLERDRKELQATIDALREEKKLLQSKLRKAATGKVAEISRNPTVTKDVSTSTEDLGAEVRDSNEGEAVAMDAMSAIASNQVERIESSALLQPANIQTYIQDSSTSIPPDQMRMIDNINSLLSELALEKEQLTSTLAVESSNNSKLKETNKELSQKLEAQTQRLELLIAQSMAHESISGSAVPTDSHMMHDATVYADEGDEVVERVLGWIMKLFPGGTTKRRTSKLL
ncbi:hypothetical protein AMTRI_Chr12g240630 [Amborella trichopoda]